MLWYMIGLKKLAPIFHPIRSTTSCGLSIHIFLHFTSAMCKYFEFWMVHWIDCMPYAIGQRDYFVSVLCWQKARNRSLITSITNTLLIYSLVSSFTLGELFASENVQTLSAKKTSLHIFMPHRGSCFPLFFTCAYKRFKTDSTQRSSNKCNFHIS